MKILSHGDGRESTLLRRFGPYKILPRDPTPALVRRYKSVLKELVGSKDLPESLSARLQISDPLCPRVYGLPKVHKLPWPLPDPCPTPAIRPINSILESPMSALLTWLVKFFSPLAGKTTSHVKNGAAFAEMVAKLTIKEDEIFWSLDVVSLYPSIPRGKTLECCYALVDEDQDFHRRPQTKGCTKKAVKRLLEFCLSNAFLRFNGTFFQQEDGGPMGLGIVALAATIFMEDFERRVLQKTRVMVSIYKRYADDVFTKTQKDQVLTLLKAMNKEHPNIKMTHETESDGKIGYLDVMVIQDEDRVQTTVHRKPCHSNQYLHFTSNHPMSHKRSVVRTLI